MRILLVEDDPDLGDVVDRTLRREGFDTAWCTDGNDALDRLAVEAFDLAVLDLMLPGTDGLTILREIRKESRIPVLLMTARGALEDKLSGFGAGADDYLPKPFALPELLVRIRALERRAYGSDRQIEAGPLSLFPERREVRVDGQALALSPREYDLLEMFVLNRGRLLTRDQLFRRVWSLDSDAGLQMVDVYVHYLRQKLAARTPAQLIETVRGTGYRFAALDPGPGRRSGP